MSRAKARSKKRCFAAVRVLEFSAYSAALLGVNLIEPLRAQDSIKAWSVLQKDQDPQSCLYETSLNPSEATQKRLNVPVKQ